MSKDTYFNLSIKGGDANGRGLTIRIPGEPGVQPGDRIKELTETARMLPLSEPERLRTEIVIAPAAGIAVHPLEDYLWGDDKFNPDRFLRHLKNYKEGRKPHDFQPRVGMTVIMEEEFIGRQQVLALLETYVADRKSCHLRAPRRYGKSSLMGRLATTRGKALMLELSDVGTLSGFLKALLRAAMRHPLAKQCLQQEAAYQSWPDTLDSASFAQVFNQAFSELANPKSPKQIVDLLIATLGFLANGEIILLADEFSIFLREMFETDGDELSGFLSQFHLLRVRQEKPLVTVFAGSAGLSTFIELYEMNDLFSDLIPIDIPPVSRQEASLLAEELFYGMKKRPSLAVIEHLVDLTGGDDTVPYFVHALASYTAEQAGRKREISADDVDKAYYDRLLGPAGNICFRDFILRERSYPNDYRKCASRLLKTLAEQAPNFVAESLLKEACNDGCELRKIMTCLEEDYDLIHDDQQGWRMRSKVIADRWRLGEPWLTLGSH